jgi:hypothetical protein
VGVATKGVPVCANAAIGIATEKIIKNLEIRIILPPLLQEIADQDSAKSQYHNSAQVVQIGYNKEQAGLVFSRECAVFDQIQLCLRR